MSAVVRRTREDDVPALVALVEDLAAYERLDGGGMTAEQLRGALFGPAPALFAHVAEVDGEVAGCALWFRNFSTLRGTHGVYLEDLFVRPERRGLGLGRALLAALARECVEHGYARLEWSVLNWNEPAIGFYRALGAEPMSEWTVYRLTDEPLRRLGEV
jgi:GNAT superfamily N-acetyltransferase